jgi:predicted component of viral defense system (DUF524 family)
MSYSDCLVVKIDELFAFEVEHTIFIVYDAREQKYVIHGKRFENNQKQLLKKNLLKLKKALIQLQK